MRLPWVAWLCAMLAAGCAKDRSSPAVGPGLGLEDGLVSDASGALDAASEQRVATYLDFVRRTYGVDYRVVIDEGDAVERSAEIFAGLDIGGETGRGLLLIVDPLRERARVEVGYGLEAFVADVAASRMMGEYLAPHFRAGDLQASLEASVEALVDEIRPALAELEAERTRPVLVGSGGAGAAVDLLRDLPVGAMDAETRAVLHRALVPQPDPRSTRDLELAMMHQGFYYQEALLYDVDWRAAKRPGSWPVARLQEIARQWDRPYEVEVQELLAVAYYRDAPALGPTFLRRESDGWLIDASSGARHVVYDYSNDSWYAIEGDYPHLALLHRVFDLRQVKLQDGRHAWMIGAAAGTLPSESQG